MERTDIIVCLKKTLKEYEKNRYHMSEDKKQKLKEYHNIKKEDIITCLKKIKKNKKIPKKISREKSLNIRINKNSLLIMI